MCKHLISKTALKGRVIAKFLKGNLRDRLTEKARRVFIDADNEVVHLGDPNSKSELAYIWISGHTYMIPRDELKNTTKRYGD